MTRQGYTRSCGSHTTLRSIRTDTEFSPMHTVLDVRVGKLFGHWTREVRRSLRPNGKEKRGQ